MGSAADYTITVHFVRLASKWIYPVNIVFGINRLTKINISLPGHDVNQKAKAGHAVVAVS